MMNFIKKYRLEIPLFFMVARLILISSVPLAGLIGYGDIFYYDLYNKLPGWPFIHYWVEYPPVFPFLSKSLYVLSKGQSHVYFYSIILFLNLIDTINIWLFVSIASSIWDGKSRLRRTTIFAGLTLGLFYTWTHFDTLTVMFILLSLYAIEKQNHKISIISISVGTLTKWFPILALPLVWIKHPPKKAFWITVGVLFSIIIVYAALFGISPELTRASLVAQANKGSWETIWALFDGNMITGVFPLWVDRTDPQSAFVHIRNASRVPSTITLLFFLGFGFWLFLKAKKNPRSQFPAFLGVIFCVFFVWSPGWSPQWVLYLLPLILLVLPEKEGVLISIALIFVNLLEWPILLSRGYMWGLWFTIPVRTLLIILLGVLFWRSSQCPIDAIRPAD